MTPYGRESPPNPSCTRWTSWGLRSPSGCLWGQGVTALKEEGLVSERCPGTGVCIGELRAGTRLLSWSLLSASHPWNRTHLAGGGSWGSVLFREPRGLGVACQTRGEAARRSLPSLQLGPRPARLHGLCTRVAMTTWRARSAGEGRGLCGGVAACRVLFPRLRVCVCRRARTCARMCTYVQSGSRV